MDTNHPAQHDYGVNCFGLTAGDILVRDGLEYRVTDGFDRDTSACWRQSRYVRCVQITGDFFRGAIQYVNPSAPPSRPPDRSRLPCVPGLASAVTKKDDMTNQDDKQAAGGQAQGAVAVSVEEMVESVNGSSWWVVLRRGNDRQDDAKYGADFKNRAEWHAASLRWILGQGPKPNISDFMDATPPAPASPAEPSETVPWPKITSYAGGASVDGLGSWIAVQFGDGPETTRFVRAPAPVAGTREALTDELVWRNDEIMSCNAECGLQIHHLMPLVRAIERAHGIAARPAGEEGAGS